MPQRNAFNPTRKVNVFDRTSGNPDAQKGHGRSGGIVHICRHCKTEVPDKPGFRPSTLRCPKCNKPVEA